MMLNGVLDQLCEVTMADTTWFSSVGEMLPDIEKYEDLCHTYWKGRGKDFPAGDHKKSFWKQSFPIAPSWLKTGVIAGVTVAGGLEVVMTVMQVMGGADVVSALAGNIPFAGIGFAVGMLAGVGLRYMREALTVKKLAALEEKLASSITILPPKYRSKFCADAFWDMYCSYGMEDVAAALPVMDQHLAANRQVYTHRAIMFDAPYAGMSGAVAQAEALEGADTLTERVRGEMLPNDIDSHTHEGVDDWEAELDSLIGMDGVKKAVRRMKTRLEFYGDSKADGVNHMSFLGGAGSGKTVVARIMCKMLYDFGYIRENRIVEVDGDYLKSQYAGATGERTQAIVDWASGGVLFVDEAYLLVSGQSGQGSEAIGVLLKAMEDARDDFIVILAGYEDKMAELLAANEGFESRIKHKLYFPAYTNDELLAIFKQFLGKLGTFTLARDAEPVLLNYFDEARHARGFGNAREARGALDAIMDIHADRVTEGIETQRNTFTKNDVEEFTSTRLATLERSGRSQFAADGMDSSIISAVEIKSHTAQAMPWAQAIASLVNAETKQAITNAAHTISTMGDSRPCVCVKGESGCGKSFAAEVMASALVEAGCTSGDSVITFTADSLRAPYVGQTTRRVDAIVSASAGCVLVIDDIDQLADASDNFAREAISALAGAIKSGKASIVLVGETSAVDHLFQENSALRNAVGWTVVCGKVQPKDVCRIVRNQLATTHCAVDANRIVSEVKARMEQNGSISAWTARDVVAAICSGLE